MKPVPASLGALLSGEQVDSAPYAASDLQAWALGPASPIFLQDAARETAFVALLHELAGDFAQSGVTPLVKGGVALWRREYPLCGSRRVHDLDVWIPPYQETNVTRVLGLHGFLQHPRYKAMWTRGYLEIDLHTHPINNARGRCFDKLFTFEASNTWNVGEPLPACPLAPWRRPSSEDLWIHMALHAVKHEFERLNLVLDLHLLLQKHLPITKLGRDLWQVASPALGMLGLGSPLFPGTPAPLARAVCLERPARPFLAGLRLMASLGERPMHFWLCLALGSTATRDEAGCFLSRFSRILPRIR